MTYATYEYRGIRGAGEVGDGRIVPLGDITEIGPRTSIDVLAAAPRLYGSSIAVEDVHLLPVVPNPTKIICVGLNYRDHVTETKRDLPTYPVMFTKYASSLLGAYDDIVLPSESTQIDYEGELAIVIGRTGRRIAPEKALDYVLGYAIANDVTMRDFQYKTHQWLQGKAWDSSTPLGPYIVTPDKVDLENSGIRTVLNGIRVQESNLSQLIFSVTNLITTISTFTTLQPGDIILTGTPGGVGFRREPQLFLKPGDTISVEIDGVGEITNAVRAETIL